MPATQHVQVIMGGEGGGGVGGGSCFSFLRRLLCSTRGLLSQCSRTLHNIHPHTPLISIHLLLPPLHSTPPPTNRQATVLIPLHLDWPFGRNPAVTVGIHLSSESRRRERVHRHAFYQPLAREGGGGRVAGPSVVLSLLHKYCFKCKFASPLSLATPHPGPEFHQTPAIFAVLWCSEGTSG